MEAGEGSPFTPEKPMDRGMERRGGRMEGDFIRLYNLQEYFPIFSEGEGTEITFSKFLYFRINFYFCRKYQPFKTYDYGKTS
jgi:hypothetical protein